MTSAQTELYRAALKEAIVSFEITQKRLRDIGMEEFRLKREIAQLRRTITALAAQCNEEPWSDELGLTESCTQVMEIAKPELSTQEVVQRLENMGFDMTTQKNPAASVHAVLTRLSKKEKIQKIEDEDKKAVTWRGPSYNPDFFDVGGIDDTVPF
jgi:hypothetical protein